MTGAEVNPFPIQLMVNYWELRPSQLSAHLDRLLAQGVNDLATFVPWQAVEADISHHFSRFLLAVSQRRMRVALLLTPDVGVHFPNSGLPKDVVGKKENAAQHFQGKPIPIGLPPNSFALPSLFAPELTKRYHNFLHRMDGFLADLAKSHPGILERVNVVLSGSFWKYYRAPQESAMRTFGGTAGDYSSAASLSFRQKLDTFLAQSEFQDPSPAAANRWRTRAMEDTNRRWFYQLSEDVFRSRSALQLRRKMRQLPVREIELFTPEADPALAYSSFLQMVAGGSGDFSKLSTLVDESASRASLSAGQPTAPVIHWTSMGGFRTLSDSEKQFLILKSLLLFGGRGGSILIDEGEWFSLSANFRARAEALARALAHGELRLQTKLLYLTSHLWSGTSPLWTELSARTGAGARVIASLDMLSRERDCGMLVVDPQFVFTVENIKRLASWAQGGRTVVLPRSSLYTEGARRELEALCRSQAKMEISLGLQYQIHPLGEGRLIVFDSGTTSTAEQESALGSPLAVFTQAILSLSEIDPYCRLSDSRLESLTLKNRSGDLAVFVMNVGRRAVTADILFPMSVEVQDLAIVFSAAPQEASQPETRVEPSSRFSLEAPPFGVLPLAVSGMRDTDAREKAEAAESAQILRESAVTVSNNELPGLDSSAGIEEAWS